MFKIVATKITGNYAEEYFINLIPMSNNDVSRILAVLESLPEYKEHYYKGVPEGYVLHKGIFKKENTNA